MHVGGLIECTPSALVFHISTFSYVVLGGPILGINKDLVVVHNKNAGAYDPKLDVPDLQDSKDRNEGE